ncbi:MAG: helix-hairpin-helix domain-containing protein [Bacteroidales bacterium]
MNFKSEPIKKWFGFTRRERRSTFMMLLIIVLIIGLRYSVPDSQISVEDITGIVADTEKFSLVPAKDSSFTRKHFSYDLNNGTKFRKISSGKMSVPQKSGIDINTSDSATLVKLPGIGPVLSARIVKYRHLLGGFARVEQLKEVYGLPPETFELIKGRIFADSTQIKRININSATYKEIIRLPYLEKYDVSAILKYRELKGRIIKITDLTDNKLITEEKAKKVSPYLNFKE